MNPVRDLDRSERPASDARERRVLTRNELEAVLAAAPERHRPLLRFAAQTGVRLGEALGLRWRDVDLDAGTATIAGQLTATALTSRRRRGVRGAAWSCRRN